MVATIITGLTSGCVYALVAMGFTLVYRAIGLVSFAQGAFVMLGGVTTGWAIAQWHVSLFTAGLFGVAVTAAAGAILAFVIVVPLWRRRAAPFVLILATALYLVVLQSIAEKAFGTNPIEVPAMAGGQFRFAGTIVLWQDVVIILGTAALCAALYLLLHHTRAGTAMRASAADREVARLMGVRPARVTVVALVLSAVLGGIGGLLIAPIQFASYTVAVDYTMRGFISSVVGGFGDLKGSVVGGLVVGFIEAFVGRYVSTAYLDVILVGLVLCVLMLRPSGLVSSPAALDPH